MSASDTGIFFTNRLALRRGLVNQNLMNGSGVAAGDVDGDGLCDLYLCGLDNDNRFYRNQGGLKFEDKTREAGVACRGQDSTGAVFADIDGDVDLDLFVTALGGGVRLFLNHGHGRFTETTDAAGLRSKAGSTSLALADIDGDSDLDLYVANIPRRPVRNELSVTYKMQEIDGERRIVAINGTPISSPELAGRFKISAHGDILEYGELDDFFLNNGNGTFSRLSFTDGRFLDEDGKALEAPPMDWGLAVRFHDLNGDRLPDLYVCNDLFTPDRIWINQGGGGFRALSSLAIRHSSLASMSADVADINRDGHYDLFVADMLSLNRHLRMTQFAHVPPKMWEDGVIGDRLQFNHNTLLLNRGDMTFAEIAFYSGVAASDWSWGGAFLDVDLDGFEDLLIPTGQQRNLAHADYAARIEAAQRARGRITLDEMRAIAEQFPPLEVPNLAFRNRGDLTFEEISAVWGFNTPAASQGMAMADLDNDGDLDVIVNNLLKPAGLYRNESMAPRIVVSLKGRGLNTAGIGAQIKVKGGPAPQQQEMICGGRYLSGDQAVRVFATGQSQQVEIEILWRSGKRSAVPAALPNHLFEIREPESDPSGSTVEVAGSVRPFFDDISQQLKHHHLELPFNDLQYQPLLPYRLARSGPGLTWYDLDQNQLDDLLVPGGQGGALAVYLNQGRANFRRVSLRSATDTTAANQTTALGWTPASNRMLLLLGCSNYKSETDRPALSIFDLSKAGTSRTVPPLDGPVGPVCMADVDGDGDLDLFVGTTARPGRHPEPGSGYLFRNERGSLVLEEHWKTLGVIKGAVFADLTSDGYPELAVACEWGPLRIMANHEGKFTEATAAWGLLEQTGFWQGITAADFDADGRLDLAASNWGLNSSLAPSPRTPKIFYYGDLNGDGQIEILEAAADPVTGKEHPACNLNLLALALPTLRAAIADYETYARSTFQDLLGNELSKLTRIEIHNLAATVFLNRGDHFEIRPLPAEALFAPAFGIAAADFDGDGADDLFLSQNSFVMGMGLTRQDAGRGLWLRGNGNGQFQAVPGQSSGIVIYGEQRGCAVSDFDQDGRPDLAVAQNNGPTKLYLNRRGSPGLCVRLRGPDGNRLGIGAVLRAGHLNHWGPAKEIHAGGGFWSMDTATPNLSRAGGADKIKVRWPGGQTTVRDLPPNTSHITIEAP
ncbi:MAG: VCBS repeat-containing protein [Chloroflexi bacterium]|nr:VCBS repeat-containing protein [Chloroflexota bacterium]